MNKLLINRLFFRNLFLLTMLVMVACGCKKDKMSNTIPLQNVGNQSSSSIRLFNFSSGGYQVTINNIPLTSYSNGSANSSQGTQLGLSLFPTGVWPGTDNGSPFSIPNSLLDKDGKAHIILGSAITATTDTILVNDVAHPKDYYVMLDGHLKVSDRNNLPPNNPENFKIRVINLGSPVDAFLGLQGPVSLTYADGSLVNATTNNIANNTTSDYIEVPYGTYQFKVFLSKGNSIDVTKQLSELPSIPHINPCMLAPALPQEGLYPITRTFKPGGVYSIVITQNYQNYIGCDNYPAQFIANSYRVILESDPGVNSTYARMSAVNAIPGKQVSVLVDGKPLINNSPYIGSLPDGPALQPPYQIIVQGTHHITAVDQSGTLLAQGDLKIYPYDNYTIWAYNKTDGKAALIFEPNDMSGTNYLNNYIPGAQGTGVGPDDGTNGTLRRGQYNYALESRFINLSPDLPYLTFTNDHQLFLPATGGQNSDTVRYFSAYVNLAPGVLPTQNPSILYGLQPAVTIASFVYPFSEFGDVPQYIRAYQSSPGNPAEIPGTLLPDIAPITVLQSFIANQNLYTTVQKNAEPGVYTVALVGKTFTAGQASEKAKLVVIKHSK